MDTHTQTQRNTHIYSYNPYKQQTLSTDCFGNFHAGWLIKALPILLEKREFTNAANFSAGWFGMAELVGDMYSLLLHYVY